MTQPSPLEARQAAQLAQALERGADGAWEAIDPEVSEAVFALRPELAPAPRADLLEEMLDDLLEGPLAKEPSEDERAEAATFARALDGDSPEALGALGEAVFALAPERAPSPSLTIDDILDSAATGPFAPVIRITGEFPAEIAPLTQLHAESDEPEPATVLPLTVRPRVAPPSRSRRWWLPATGVLAAAAALVLFVGPSMQLQQAESMPVLEEVSRASSPATRDASADARGLAEPADEAFAADLALEPPPPPKTKDRSARRGLPKKSPRAQSSSRAAAPERAPPTAAPEPEPAPEPAAAAPAEPELEVGSVEVADELEEAPRDLDRADAGALDDEAPRARSASAGASAAPRSSSGSSTALGLLEPSLAEARPDLHAIWAQAEQLRRQGNYTGSASVLLSLARSDRDADVVIDAAVRAGFALRMVGDDDSARSALAVADGKITSKSRLLQQREALRTTLSPR